MLKPMLGSVILEYYDNRPERNSGIILPTETEQITNIGKVVAIGEPEHGLVCPAKIGDIVLFRPFSEQRFMYEKKGHMFVKIKDLVAIYEHHE